MAQRSEVKGNENNIEVSLDRAQSTARSTGVHDVHRRGLVNRPVDRGKGTVGLSGRPTDMSQLSVGPGRPTDVFCSPFWIQTPFLFSDRIQSGFPKSLGLSGSYTDCLINKISLSLAPRT